MTPKQTPAEFLRSLGRTADEVAKRVPAGIPRSPCGCPLSTALTQAFGGVWSIGEGEFGLRCEPTAGDLPEACRAFVRRFDAGLYPHLVSKR
jgi:hypothetical protein